MGWGNLTCIYLSCKIKEFHVFILKELGKGIQQDPQVKHISFCCASCRVLDDIMIISCCFCKCDKLRMCILIWLFSLGLSRSLSLINTHCWNEIKLMRPWWKWWFDTLWITFTRLWPTYSYHVYFGLAKSDTKWLLSKYIGNLSAISSLISFFPLCFFR